MACLNASGAEGFCWSFCRHAANGQVIGMLIPNSKEEMICLGKRAS